MTRLTRDGLTATEMRVYDLGWLDAWIEFNAAMADFVVDMKGDQALARKVMQERLRIGMQLHATRHEVDGAS